MRDTCRAALNTNRSVASTLSEEVSDATKLLLDGMLTLMPQFSAAPPTSSSSCDHKEDGIQELMLCGVFLDTNPLSHLCDPIGHAEPPIGFLCATLNQHIRIAMRKLQK